MSNKPKVIDLYCFFHSYDISHVRFLVILLRFLHVTDCQ